MKKVGLIGWRGLVGSVLLKRMQQEDDFKKAKYYYFSTSNPNTEVVIHGNNYLLKDANSIWHLAEMDIILTCQGSSYTNSIYDELRNNGWQGYWIDASSAKRMHDDSIIALDPVNKEALICALDNGIKNFIGGNCSITLSLLGLNSLFKENLVEWCSMMTYQAASGAGAAYVRELLSQVKYLSDNLDFNNNANTLNVIENAHKVLSSEDFPKQQFCVPLLGNIIPWIDTDLMNGSSKEEWKGEVELNKILGLSTSKDYIKVDGLCIRVSSLRSHSAAITFKLKKNLSLEELEAIIKKSNPWINFIANNKESSIHHLSPIATSESLKIAVGRLKKLNIGENLYSVLTVGDQLLWGAAEPLRRMLNILLQRS
jgi:aspartate-semialdehyde dehydrogenase